MDGRGGAARVTRRCLATHSGMPLQCGSSVSSCSVCTPDQHGVMAWKSFVAQCHLGIDPRADR
eukprot:6369918-Pyramimonas_sp.AAC.1